MIHGMIGKKLGMIQIFDESGQATGVTVVEAGPCTIVGKKAESRVQVGFGPTKEKKLSKPVLGQFRQAGVGAFSVMKEFVADEPDLLEIGQEIRADIFAAGERVKVVGTSKGKGFAGVIKRWNFSGGPKTHGSRSHRIPGSIGQCAWPSRVFKGQKMPGRLGGTKVTAPRVEVLEVRSDENLIFLKGPIPGARGSLVIIRKR
jgi:large subunit ribosomal protein L3